MKIGIISDIHGNKKALDAVLKQLEKENIDKIICLGDLIGGAPRSEEVVQKIISMEDRIITVRGNREKYIIEGMPKVVHDEKIKVSDEQLQRNEWLKKGLSDSSLEFMTKLPKEIIYETEGKKIYIAHYPMNKDGSFRKHIKRASVEENEQALMESLTMVKSGQVTFAVRDTVMNDVEVKEGNIIGIAESKLMDAGDSVDEITTSLVEKLVDEDSAIITLFYGEDVTEEDANNLRDELEEKFEDLDIELYYGGQPLYYYLISVE